MKTVKRALLVLALGLFYGCVSTTNLDAIRAVQVTTEVAAQDRQECETEAVEAGKKSFPSSSVRTVSNIGMWPIPEIVIASERDEAAISAYRKCLEARGYTIPEAKQGK